jgi:membrane associated rhomboid family serine protease
MGGLVPLSDASRRPVRIPLVTALIIVINIFVFVLELSGGDAFVLRWSAIPAQIISGHRWITILTAMFMHGSWSHIIGNMVFLWAFAPEIEDAMGRGGYLGLGLVDNSVVYNAISSLVVPNKQTGPERARLHSPQARDGRWQLSPNR